MFGILLIRTLIKLSSLPHDVYKHVEVTLTAMSLLR